MGKIIRNGVEFSGTLDNAANVNYNNELSGMEATTVQEAIDEITESLPVIQKGITIPVIMSYRHTGGVYHGIIYSKNIGELTVISAKTYNDDNWAEIAIDASNITAVYVESVKGYLISIAYTDCGGKLVDIIFG